MSTIVTTDDLAVFGGLVYSDPNDEDRAQMLIDDAIAQALSVVTVGTVAVNGPTEANLPPGAASVIRAAVKRLYNNPSDATTEALGPYSIGRPASTGAIFSKAERAQLRRFAGGGNAFSVNPLANYTGAPLPFWDVNATDPTIATS